MTTKMDIRKASLSCLKVCRFCLTSEEKLLLPLYDKKSRAPKTSVPLALKILACISIEIFPSDQMPKYICQRCKLFMELSYAFKQICRQSDENVLQFIQEGSPVTPISWPLQLTKMYRAYQKAEVNVVETVVQGGATVKVMAQEVTDSEGDDDNVYNVKIDDGIEESKSIKVITSQEKSKQGLGNKNYEESSGTVVRGCWPCDQCECTYPLEQLLTLHIAQKHRKQFCDECGAEFLSKNELENHLQTHSSEWPFQCVICDKKFKRHILLKRHEKINHCDIPQLSCPNCPATFLSQEELEVHQTKHSRHPVKPYYCFCNKSFPTQSLLEKHKNMVHRQKPGFSCQYCPEQFPTVAKLKRHVREHAGEKPYPCKYCDKTFTKSHHYTRHLRVKHTDATISAGTYTEADAYRCEECEETFSNQDELMYHSALHATKNLTCPLCQEKFNDVDTVTAHIKSHVNGTEFMCDFCELTFTTKEKLDNHLVKMHEEELMANEEEHDPDESSMDMDAEEDEDGSINVKEQNGEMVVEIKNPDEFMLPASQTEEDRGENTQSEEDMNYADSLSMEMEMPQQPQKQTEVVKEKPKQQHPAPEVSVTNQHKVTKPADAQATPITPSPILRKAEEIKRKALELQKQEKKEKPKVETSSAPSGASDKSLRLLEKELQDLKRTSRAEATKTPARAPEPLRNKRMQMFFAPKNRNADKKETASPKAATEKTPTSDKKQVERKVRDNRSNNNSLKEDKEEKDTKVIKEEDNKGNKEERVSKEVKGNTDEKENKASKEEKEGKGKEEKDSNNKEDKKANNKEDKKEHNKEDKKDNNKEEKKDNAKPLVKNGGSETPNNVEESVRRSTRPSKVKDYAKMIRDNSMNESDEEDDDSEDMEEEEEYQEEEKTPEVSQVPAGRGRGRPRTKPLPATPKTPAPTPSKTPAPTPTKTPAKVETPASAPRKRGRPRKEPKPEVPPKIKKEEPADEEEEKQGAESESPPKNPPDTTSEEAKTPDKGTEARPGVIMSPSGHTLKKVPIKALPPGVKALPLPGNPTRLTGGEVTEMQIGKKIVKVQKIVMTKAEVEAMTKKGLLEIKDGTMVLKQGIKLPATDPNALKTTLVGEGDQNKESTAKQAQSTSTRHLLPRAVAHHNSDDYV